MTKQNKKLTVFNVTLSISLILLVSIIIYFIFTLHTKVTNLQEEIKKQTQKLNDLEMNNQNNSSVVSNQPENSSLTDLLKDLKEKLKSYGCIIDDSSASNDSSNEQTIESLKKSKTKLEKEIEEIEKTIKDELEDKKSDAVFQRAIETFQSLESTFTTTGEKQDCVQLISLMKTYQVVAENRNSKIKELENSQKTLNMAASSRLEEEINNQKTKIESQKEKLNKIRIYLNNYAIIISLYLEDTIKLQTLMKSENTSPTIKAQLKQIKATLSKEMTKDLLKLNKLNSRDDELIQFLASLRDE
ncbi:hypothetical protein [Candidatus Phytoplasma solani]|uniref:hypothetical protein n=1 Tax=Candidatus Phytoplasma solani TaxID=69896 RepID=UPI0003B7D906|nr:hypothetical protein [Candidatus Phytoplasma solani]CCP88303.1 hypothetical protein S284_03660 [Candidatus Phytoplasma solani]